MGKTKLTEEEIQNLNKLNEEARAFCSNGKGKKISIIISALSFLVLCFFWTPAVNVKEIVLYKIILIILLEYGVLRIATSGFYTPSRNIIQSIRFLFREEKITSYTFTFLVLVVLLGYFFSSPVFHSGDYTAILKVREGDFAEDVSTISFDEIPVIDTASAGQLGKRALGELADMVSQFETDSNYIQINLNNIPTSIASLKYGNIFKWLANQNYGLPGYVCVNMLTQETEVVRVMGGIRYSASEPFFRNINRYLRIHYPTYLFDSAHLEIDNNGSVWWICPRLEKSIGLFGGDNVIGAVLVDACSGEFEYYSFENVPQWVDQLCSSSLIEKQYNWYGRYGGGFLNSLLSQSGVTELTSGCNFIALDDDVYMYSGVTSVGKDESNIGFLLCNMRTRQASYYVVSGATELSAQSSAQGAVQHLNYTATFPLLLNISDKPTYFMALKDSANLAKKYAMVNVEQYQLVAIGDTIQKCEEEYISLLSENGIIDSSKDYLSQADTIMAEGIVKEIRSSVIQGTSIYYIVLEDNATVFKALASRNENAVMISPDMNIRIEYIDSENEFKEVVFLTY